MKNRCWTFWRAKSDKPTPLVFFIHGGAWMANDKDKVTAVSNYLVAAMGLLRETTTDLDVTETIRELEGEMLKASEDLQFEKAALLRDQIKELNHLIDGTKSEAKPVSYRKSGGRRAKA